MRRSRWAEPEEEEKRDDPVTLTESQYRALKRGALFGTFGLALGVAATGLAVWSLARTPGQPENPTVAEATAHPGMMDPGAGPPPDTASAGGVAPAQPAAPNVMTPPPAASATPKAATTAPRRTASVPKASAPKAPAPAQTTAEKPTPRPASEVLGDVAPPSPVAAEPPKPVEGTGSTP